MNNLGLLAHQHGRPGDAVPLLEGSLRLFESQRDARGTARALNNLGQALQATGEHERSLELNRRALALRLDLDDRHGIALALETIAHAVGAQDDVRRAVCLLGAADAIRATIGAPLGPEEAAQQARWLAGARTTLGDDEFADAWRSGRRMTPTEAAREAGALTTG
jgi:hypothetical protein